MFIKDRPLYSRNGKSYFCTNKNSAPIVAVIGKLSHFGVCGKVFTGKGWMVSKLHLLSFCSDGTHVAVGLCVSSLSPFCGIPAGKAVPSCLLQPALAWTLLSGQGITIWVATFSPGHWAGAGFVWMWGLRAAGAQSLSAAEGLKEASLINAITQTCSSHVSYLIPSQEKRHSSGHCFCLSQRDIPVPQASSLHPLWLFCALGGNQYWPSDSSEEQLSLQDRGNSVPGRDFIAGRALAAMQTSQAAGTAGCGSLPGCPVAFLLCGKDPFAIGDLPKEAVRALTLLLLEAGAGQVQECTGGRDRDPPEIVLCGVGLLLTK